MKRVHTITLPSGDTLTIEARYHEDGMGSQGRSAHAHVERTMRAYQPPQGDQAQRYSAITAATHNLAVLYADLAPPSPELTMALRDLEMARMRVNQAIAINEPREG
jgi:hypothetical protein